jgi:hypothetical protein
VVPHHRLPPTRIAPIGTGNAADVDPNPSTGSEPGITPAVAPLYAKRFAEDLSRETYSCDI